MDTTSERADEPFALDVIRSWPDAARQAAHAVILVHGAPDELDTESLRWDGVGPWTRVAVCAHDDRGGAADAVESVLEATIPAGRRDDVEAVAAEFNVTVEDDGELSVRGPDLHANAITLNVLHALVHDELTPQEARVRRTRQLADLHDGHPPEDANVLHFADDAPHGEPQTIDVDERSQAARADVQASPGRGPGMGPP